MLESAVNQLQNDVQRLQSISSGYAQEWNDTVSERVFGGISALASTADSVYSQLYTQVRILEDIRSGLTQLAQF